MTTGRISVECDCVKDGCNKWRPQVSVNAEINVYFANDTTIPPGTLKRDEAEHVTAVQSIVSGTCRAGEALEATSFSSKTVCDWNCFVFKASAWLALFLERTAYALAIPVGTRVLMRIITATIVLIAATSTLACSDRRWAEVQVGMAEGEVRERLGEPSRVTEDLAAPSIYMPRSQDCKPAAKKCLIYERWSGRALLVYIDREARVACAERSMITRSH